jgi:hypothetical protein
MYVKIELKRFRVVKEVGRIVMNVRIFACYYQLIEVCQVSFKRFMILNYYSYQ